MEFKERNSVTGVKDLDRVAGRDALFASFMVYFGGVEEEENSSAIWKRMSFI